MKFTELALHGVWLIEPVAFDDERGSFWRDFCADEYAAHGLSPTVAQGNGSRNTHRGTLRGFHYQAGPFGEAKTIACVTGSIYDIVVDLRKDSPTFMQWISLEISAAGHQSLYVPVGCANAWLTTAPDTTLHYYMSERFVPDSYRGIRYNDPAFGFRWPSEPVVISEKDRTHPDFTPASLDEK
jgi:dTDP-4-dehydrorhamnose 3,5-epimerase